MKKIFSILLCLVVILSCVACHVDTNNETGGMGTTGETLGSGSTPESSVPEAVGCPILFAPFENVGNDPNNAQYADIVFDATYVYFSGFSTFYRIPRTGGAAEQICDHYLSAPNVYRRKLYGIFDGSILCIDPHTGKEQILFDEMPVSNKEIDGVPYHRMYRIGSLFIADHYLFFNTVEDYWEDSDDCLVHASVDFRSAIHAIDLHTGQLFKDLYVDKEGSYGTDGYVFAPGEDGVYAVNMRGKILWISFESMCDGGGVQKLPRFAERTVDGLYFGHNGFIAMTGNGAEYRAYLYDDFHNSEDETYYGTVFLNLDNHADSAFVKGKRAVIGGNLLCERGDGMLHLHDGISNKNLTDPLFDTDILGMIGVYKDQLYYLQRSEDGSLSKMIVVNSDGTYKEYSNS